jgi:hypothetical protein
VAVIEGDQGGGGGGGGRHVGPIGGGRQEGASRGDVGGGGEGAGRAGEISVGAGVVEGLEGAVHGGHRVHLGMAW